MAFVLKVAYGFDIRRKRFATAADVTFKEVDSFVRSAFGMTDFVAKYTDDEGDQCILEELTLPDALELASEKQILRVDISAIPQKQVAEVIVHADDAAPQTTTGLAACGVDTAVEATTGYAVCGDDGASQHTTDSGAWQYVANDAASTVSGGNFSGMGACDFGSNPLFPFGMDGGAWDFTGFGPKGWAHGHGKGKGKAWWGKGSCGEGAEECWGRGGPKRLVFILKAMRESQCLSADAVSALLLQWLPMITQRAVRKMDKLTKVGPKVVGKIKPAIIAVAKTASNVPELKQLATRLQRVADDPASEEVGLLVVEFLKALGDTEILARRQVISDFVTAVLPCLDDLLDSFGFGWAPAHTSFVHTGVICDGCSASPLQGLRFKCTTCPNYDLCASCYMKKEQLHDGSHEFTNVLDAAKENGWKGKGKGWKGWKGMNGGW